ncbi:unnamed protein product [Didymodactylos carnosus]|uniref:Uncharacterized protein n=1 Tax=Didymodactylos carnosus TaxID=1234261 RepID=A0A814ENS0_9BILA|nr:unnamed protein product [Didymodactylos carnosus]CAF3744949.1 unnamed protein product [Didymodactylos carnosus]
MWQSVSWYQDLMEVLAVTNDLAIGEKLKFFRSYHRPKIDKHCAIPTNGLLKRSLSDNMCYFLDTIEDDIIDIREWNIIVWRIKETEQGYDEIMSKNEEQLQELEALSCIYQEKTEELNSMKIKNEKHEESERRRFEDACVTVELFINWIAKFDVEMAELKKVEICENEPKS